MPDIVPIRIPRKRLFTFEGLKIKEYTVHTIDGRTLLIWEVNTSSPENDTFSSAYDPIDWTQGRYDMVPRNDSLTDARNRIEQTMTRYYGLRDYYIRSFPIPYWYD